MYTPRRRSFTVSSVTSFGFFSRAALPTSNTKPRDSSNVYLRAIGTRMWMPRDPVVFGKPCRPRSSSTPWTRSAASFTSAHVAPAVRGVIDPGVDPLRSEVGLVLLIEVHRRDAVGEQLQRQRTVAYDRDE